MALLKVVIETAQGKLYKRYETVKWRSWLAEALFYYSQTRVAHDIFLFHFIKTARSEKKIS